jgi:hypothetical protein
MAATGLLGINPYRKGVAVDISSKPTSLYIDIQNKERARTDALDRYFMDYDKNINPAGMKANDIDDLTKLQQEGKGFYFQNKKAIQNPMLDGGKAYNQFVNYNKQQLALVSQSKDAAARAKIAQQAISNAKNKGYVIGEQTFNNLQANEAPVLSKGFKSWDAATFDAYEPFNAEKFSKGIGWKDYLSTKVAGIKTIKGQDVVTEVTSYDPKNNDSILTIAKTNYNNNKGFRTQVDEIAKDPTATELKALNPIFKKYFNRDISNIDDVATAFTISLSPYKTEDVEKTNPYYTAGARPPQTEFNPEVYVGSIYQSGLPLNESNVKNVLSKNKSLSALQQKRVLTEYPNTKLIAALPQELASIYVEKVGRGTYKPDIILMRNDNQNLVLGFEDNGELSFQEIPRNVILADATAGAGVAATKQVYSGTAPKTQPTTTPGKKVYDPKTGKFIPVK